MSVYPYTPAVELFCLSRWIFTSYLARHDRSSAVAGTVGLTEDPGFRSLPWTRLRIHVCTTKC